MFSLLSRILKRSHQYPVAVVLLSLFISSLSLLPISHLKWDLQLIDALPDFSLAKQTNEKFEKEFGGVGTLTLVSHAKDSLKNNLFIQKIVSEINKSPLVNYVEYKGDSAFYTSNQFLYIHYDDLKTIQDRIKNFKKELILQENPFWVDLVEEEEEPLKTSLSFQDIEAKYLKKIKNSYQSSDGLIKIVDIYPKHQITDLKKSRAILREINNIVQKEILDSISVYYTGEVYHVTQTGKTLLPESKKMGYITAFLIAFLLIIHFYRQPQLIIASAFPIVFSMLWTLSIAYFLYGRINLFTLLLALILPGHACQQIIHLLKRYAEERQQNLSPTLSLESAILGIGPATAASSFISAATFLSISLIPLAGLQELGILACIGILINWILANTLLPSILILFQRKKHFSILKPKLFQVHFKAFRLPKMNPFFALFFIFAITLTLLAFIEVPRFEYDFSKTENLSQEVFVDSLLHETSYPYYEPAIIVFDKNSESEVFYDEYLKLKNNYKTISSVITFANLLPSQQEKKIQILQEIREELTPELLEYTKASDSLNMIALFNSWTLSELNPNDLPLNIRHKFESSDGSLGKFAFVFPKESPYDGLFCRRFKKELSEIKKPNGETYSMTGTPIIRAEILNLTLPYIHRSIITAVILILFLTLILYNKLSYTLFVLIAPTVSFIWLLIAIHFLGIKLSAYSAIAFPILIALSVDASIQFWNSYFEYKKTSAAFIMNKIGLSIFIAQLATLIGTYGLLLSSHNGLKSIGSISLLGLLFIIVAHFIFFPLLAASLDLYRQKKRNSNENTFS